MSRDRHASAQRSKLRSVSVQGELAERIDQGRLAAGTRLPSEPELAAEFGVSRATLREALRALEGQGLVRRLWGSGTYVADRTRVANSLDLNFGVSDAIRAAGMQAGTEQGRHRIGPASASESGADPMPLRATLIRRTDPATVPARSTASAKVIGTVRVLSRRPKASTGRPSLADAATVVAGGRGVGSADGFKLIGRLADTIVTNATSDATDVVCASRAMPDATRLSVRNSGIQVQNEYSSNMWPRYPPVANRHSRPDITV